MSFHGPVAVGLSLVAVIVSLHTKYKQRQKNQLRELARSIEGTKSALLRLHREILSPRTDEDLELRLYEIPREILACAHELEEDDIGIAPNLEKGTGENSRNVESLDEGVELFENGEYMYIKIKVGSVKGMYMSDREFRMRSPLLNIKTIRSSIKEIRDNHGDIVEDFDNGSLNEVDTLSMEILSSIIENIQNNEFSEIDVSDKTVNEIGDEIFEEVIYYDGIEEDLNRLDDLIDNVEELRQVVLQTSYT